MASTSPRFMSAEYFRKLVSESNGISGTVTTLGAAGAVCGDDSAESGRPWKATTTAPRIERTAPAMSPNRFTFHLQRTVPPYSNEREAPAAARFRDQAELQTERSDRTPRSRRSWGSTWWAANRHHLPAPDAAGRFRPLLTPPGIGRSRPRSPDSLESAVTLIVVLLVGTAKHSLLCVLRVLCDQRLLRLAVDHGRVSLGAVGVRRRVALVVCGR